MDSSMGVFHLFKIVPIVPNCAKHHIFSECSRHWSTKITLLHHIGLTHQLRARAKERERERRRNSGNNITPGLIPRAVRRNERTSERVVAELENCKRASVLSNDHLRQQMTVQMRIYDPIKHLWCNYLRKPL